METSAVLEQLTPLTEPLITFGIKGLATSNPRYKVCEYLLLLGLDQHWKDRAMFHKRNIFLNFPHRAAILNMPHIKLASFIQSDMADSVLIHRLKTIGKNTNLIKLVLKDSQWFPSLIPFIDVASKIHIQQLVRSIEAGIKRLVVTDSRYSPEFMLEPSLTICNNLCVEQYGSDRVEYSQEIFFGEFNATAMLLLKRELGKNNYGVVARFEFAGHKD